MHAAKQLVDTEKDGLDYLVADYLAEVTMGLLARRSRLSKDPTKARPGYSELSSLALLLRSHNKILLQSMRLFRLSWRTWYDYARTAHLAR